MSSINESPRPQPQVRSAQEAIALNVYDRLLDEPCVSFVVSCGGCVEFAPATDIAVRLLSIATRGGTVDDGRLVRVFHESWITPAFIESGKRAIVDCVDWLHQCGQPFELLAHLEGQTNIEVHVRRDTNEPRFRQLAHCLAQEVCLLAGPA